MVVVTCFLGIVMAMQSEGLVECDPAELPGGRLRHDDVPAFDRGGEDPTWMPLRCQRPSRWGRTATTA